MPRLLVADDDPDIVELIRATLEPEGFEVFDAATGEEAVRAMQEEDYDLVILDVMMPKMDGMEACRRIRQISEVPIIFLSAKDEETDKVVGFALGADDYVTKPFKPRELTARIRARLRRDSDTNACESILSASSITMDLRAHRATLHGKELELTPKEFDILSLLLRNAGRPVPVKELFGEVWHEPYRSSDANTIMVHIRRLRKKLASIDSSQSFIETVFGVGYKIENSNESSNERDA